MSETRQKAALSVLLEVLILVGLCALASRRLFGHGRRSSVGRAGQVGSQTEDHGYCTHIMKANLARYASLAVGNARMRGVSSRKIIDICMRLKLKLSSASAWLQPLRNSIE